MPFLKTPRGAGSPRAVSGRMSARSGLRAAVFYPGGGKYIGEWRDDLRHGKGAEHTGSRLYEGDWRRDVKHGYGVLSTKICDGTYAIDYAGNWAHGKKQGHGVRHFADGGLYDGSWKANRRSGYGRMWFPNNTFYEGDWRDDRFHGLGLFVQANVNRYEGHWQDGLQHGYGRFYHLLTGQMQEGVWRNGVVVRSAIVDIRYRQSALYPTPYPIPRVELKEPDKIIDEGEEDRKSLGSENNQTTE